MTNAFNLLDNMDGLAATLAAIAFGFFAIDAVTVHPTTSCSRSRSPARPRASASCRSTCGRDGRALVFMGDSGSQMLGFALAALGLASSWRVAGTTVATLSCRSSILAVPILDTALVTVVRLLEGRPIYQGGRDHSSHRLVRFGLSEQNAVALLALIATGIGALEPRLQRARQRPLDDRRRRGHVRAARAVRELPRRHRAAAAAGGEARRASRRRSPCTGGALVEVLVDFAVITGSFVAAYAIAFGWPGTDDPAAHRRPDAADRARGALPRLHPVRPLPLGLALRRRARRGRDRLRGRRLRGGRARVHGR